MEKKATPKFKDLDISFIEAIETGRLSLVRSKPNWAGNYMYMGHWNGKALFKNINSRKYDV